MATPKENIINAIKWLIPNLEKKFAAITHKHTKSEITDFPSSMPASDVYSWAKSSSKPSYTKSEVGLGNVDNTADSTKSVKYATSAGSAGSADKLSNSAGSATQPVYFSNGKPAACSYTLGKSVPSNAVFTNTWRGIQDNLTSTSTTDSLSANQGKLLKDSIDSLNSNLDQRVQVVHYFSGTYDNTTFVGPKLSEMGITGKKLRTYPAIVATVNTNVGNFYVESAIRNSDDQIVIIFNRAYSGSFIIALSFLIEDA